LSQGHEPLLDLAGALACAGRAGGRDGATRTFSDNRRAEPRKSARPGSCPKSYSRLASIP